MKNSLNIPNYVYIRRDYMPDELDLDRHLRRNCFEMNRVEKFKRFVVRDLQIVDKGTHKLTWAQHVAPSTSVGDSAQIGNDQRKNFD